jgi:ferric-dicitrate binding protein FerR (iron transport regulator)
MLAPRSRLVLAPNFGRVARAVTLSGEAYFDVIANPNIPFSVRTGNVLTNVLGTKFDVRHDTVDGRVYVAVETGRVRSKGGSAIITLAAGSVGVVTDSTAIVTTTNASGFSPWQNGDLVFDNTPVPVVLTRVGRLYGYTFVLADSTLNDSRITTTLPVTESAETIQAILDLLDVTMTTRDSTITLHTIPRMRQNKFRERRQMLNHGVSHTEVGR